MKVTVIVIVSDSDIRPNASRKSRADIGHFYGLTLARNNRYILDEFLTLTIAILDEFLTLMYQHRRATDPKCVKVEDKFPFPRGIIVQFVCVRG